LIFPSLEKYTSRQALGVYSPRAAFLTSSVQPGAVLRETPQTFEAVVVAAAQPYPAQGLLARPVSDIMAMLEDRPSIDSVEAVRCSPLSALCC
jgi:hypothetical protein